DRLVAVKVLRPEFSRLMRARQRFSQEAKVMAALRHPHIIPIHEISESQGIIYFSMDYMTSGSLASRLPSSSQVAVGLIETVARTIHFAHTQNVIHCDLKPSNILLDDLDRPLVSDFGLALLPTQESDVNSPGQIVGTPAYMAPEQLDSGRSPITPATDIWAL